MQTLADRLSVKTLSRPSCNQDNAGLDRNSIWSPEDKRITALMPVNTSGARRKRPSGTDSALPEMSSDIEKHSIGSAHVQARGVHGSGGREHCR